MVWRAQVMTEWELSGLLYLFQWRLNSLLKHSSNPASVPVMKSGMDNRYFLCCEEGILIRFSHIHLPGSFCFLHYLPSCITCSAIACSLLLRKCNENKSHPIYKHFCKLKKLQNMARITAFTLCHEKQKRSGKCMSALFPKNKEGRSMLLWELNRMFCPV